MIYPLHPATTALLVIDAQEEYFDPEGPASFPEASECLGTINRLIGAFGEAGAQVIYVRHSHRANGADVGRMGDFDGEDDSFVEGSLRVAFHPGLLVDPEASVITKNRYDAFVGTDLLAVLNTLGISTLVLVGYMTSFCIDSTARGSQSRDLSTLVVADAVAGPDLERLDGRPYPSAEVTDDVLAALAAGIAEVVDADEIVERLGRG